jgi:6-pyruvoyltetrahydropterin/6-carboxytetrahydropterin synthase
MVNAVVLRDIEIDYGHTLPDHFYFCNQIHGHRAKITVAVEGELSEEKNSSNRGMVLDFKILKEIMMKEICDVLDHGFAVFKDDAVDLEFIRKRNKRFLVTDEPPTAEYLAKWAFFRIKEKLPSNIKLLRVEWKETPSNTAIYAEK